MKLTRPILIVVGLALAVALGANLPSKPKQRERLVVNPLPSINVQDRIWWKQTEKIDKLSLTPQQREEMDSLLQRFLTFQPDPGGRLGARESFVNALKEGDWDGARAGAESLAGFSAGPIQRTGELMIGAIRVLTPEQRDALVEHFPELLERQWVRQPRGRRTPAVEVSQPAQEP